jgi:hypothetical protein
MVRLDRLQGSTALCQCRRTEPGSPGPFAATLASGADLRRYRHAPLVPRRAIKKSLDANRDFYPYSYPLTQPTPINIGPTVP